MLVFIIPVVAGGFVAAGERAGILGSMQAILLTVTITILPLSILVIAQGRVILRSEKRLQENWKRYQELFEHIFDGVLVFQQGTSVGRFFLVEINEAAASLLGVRRQEVLEKELGEAFPFMLETRILPAMQEVQCAGQVVKLGRIRCARLGSPIWLNGALYPLSSGTIVLVMENITAQTQAEENIQDLARFPQENPNPVMRVSLDGSLLFANPSSRPLLGILDGDGRRQDTRRAHDGASSGMGLGREAGDRSP